jgi:hypothetical protein
MASMAQILLTEPARQHLRDAIAAQSMQRPIVTVAWSQGAKDNYRGPHGEALWRTVEEPGWFVHLRDWADTPEFRVEGKTVLMEGFEWLIDAHARDGAGVLVIGCEDDALTITQRSA